MSISTKISSGVKWLLLGPYFTTKTVFIDNEQQGVHATGMKEIILELDPEAEAMLRCLTLGRIDAVRRASVVSRQHAALMATAFPGAASDEQDEHVNLQRVTQQLWSSNQRTTAQRDWPL